MIPQKLQFQAFSFVMSFFMSGVMSLTMLAIESNDIGQTLINWPKAWAIAMLVAFPCSLVVVPLTQRLMAKLVIKK